MIIIFTGNGKGKTTAALGQAIRAIGQGKRVLIIQFIKAIKSGEHKFFQKFQMQSASWRTKFQIIRAGKGFVGILGDKLAFSVHKKAAEKALVLVKKVIESKKWDLIILDEINVAINLKLIKADDVLKILKNLPNKIDIILTGRGVPKSFIKIADLVTEMKEIKHPFNKGKSASKGVEF
ncbi:MAG: cob(I)yrinic acid a,c-diamide adenosyltransferase [Patescibacteria group bacterium]